VNSKTKTIIQNTRYLKLYEYDFLSKDILKLFNEESYKISNDCGTKMEYVLMRLNCFLGLINYKINIKNLSQVRSHQVLSEFVFFINNNGFKDSRSTIKSNSSAFNRTYNVIRDNKKLKCLIKIENFDYNRILKDRVFYFNDFTLNEPKMSFCNLIKFYKEKGSSQTEDILCRIKNFSINDSNMERRFSGRLLMFNNFLEYWHNLNYPILSQELFYDYLKKYFIDSEKRSLSIAARKKEWNYFVPFIIYIFNLDEDTVIKVPESEIKGNFTKIITKNGKEIKNKLITEVPLEVTDEDAIKILFQQINQDVKFVENWSNYTINKSYNVFKNEKDKITKDEYKLSSSELLSKRNVSKENLRLSTIINEEGLVRNTLLLAIQFKLVVEHPEITESFFKQCFYYDNRNNIICFNETDAGIYFISQKPRIGKNNAEQKILLNKDSQRALDIYIEMTKEMRESLKEQNNEDYKKLFICLGNRNINPFAPKNADQSIDLSRITPKQKVKYFIEEENMSQKEAECFAKKFSLTKMRASRAIQVYIETESTKKMSKALGHTRYNPELLSHYLPEPIQNFFKSRWIRIFQKGIICEAMKDSKLLLKASSFKNMEDLDMFLHNHALKNIPDSENNYCDQAKQDDDLFISINERILAALMSLHKAVVESDRSDEICPKALYWSKFSEKLINEISNKKEHIIFKQMLPSANKLINKNLFKEVIYVGN
jgi:hypothetical protein